MIDWLNVAANSLWIVGCAIALAALSRASWQSAIQQVKLRTILEKPGYQVALTTAASLFCLGGAGAAQSALKIILWLALAIGFAGLAIAVKVRSGKSG